MRITGKCQNIMLYVGEGRANWTNS